MNPKLRMVVKKKTKGIFEFQPNSRRDKVTKKC